MAARAARRNARRTWDDGSGCPQRPLHPHTRHCVGWDWSGPRKRPTIYRCDQCRIFDDDEDAAEHVARCAACQAEIWPPEGPMVSSSARGEPAPMPALRKRRKWSSWANDVGRMSRYAGAPRLDPDSHVSDLIRWLVWNDPNGDYDPPDDPPEEDGGLAHTWATLGELAESDED
jgi:hypothetical protein